MDPITIGIRNSQLSLAQTEEFIKKLRASNSDIAEESIIIKYIKTTGDVHSGHRLDQIGGKGLFVKEIEEQILNSNIDAGVHSMKDLPAKMNKELEIACWMPRLDPRDALLSNANTSLSELPSQAVVGTSSIRRRSQLLNLRKDLNIKLLRGNVDTRIQKLQDGQYDAIILSYAGLKRLGLQDKASYIFPLNLFLPAACQGAVGIQVKSQKNENLKKLLQNISDKNTEITCAAERIVLQTINANCNSPVSVYVNVDDDMVTIQCDLFDHSGEKFFSDRSIGAKEESTDLALEMGKKIIKTIGQETIDQLDVLKDDFNYSPKT